MTGLELLPRKAFELTLSDGTKVQGQFGTWALSRFGQKRKLGLNDLMAVFSENPQLSDMIDFVLCAVEYKERQTGLPATFNDLKFAQWIDDYTAATGEPGVLMVLFNHASREEDKPEEKKSQEPLVGVNSLELPVAQE